MNFDNKKGENSFVKFNKRKLSQQSQKQWQGFQKFQQQSYEEKSIEELSYQPSIRYKEQQNQRFQKIKNNSMIHKINKPKEEEKSQNNLNIITSNSHHNNQSFFPPRNNLKRQFTQIIQLDKRTVPISPQKTQYIPKIAKQNRIPIYSQQIQIYPIRGKIIYRGFAAKNSYQYIKHLSQKSKINEQNQNNKPKRLQQQSNRIRGFQFNSSFQCGNLNIASKVSQDQFDLYMKTDTNTNGHRQWFYFTIKNKNKATIKLNIFRFKKKYSLFERGMKPYVRSAKGLNKWQAAGQKIKYNVQDDHLDKNFLSWEKKTYYLSFEYTFLYEQDTVQFAASLPYSYTFLRQQLSNFQGLALKDNRIQFKYSCLTNSLAGLQVPLITIYPNRPFKKNQNKAKKYIIINGRTHPGQTSSSWVVDGILNQIVSSSQVAQWIYNQNYYFKIIPMLNPDGVFCGNYRTGILGDDFNRNFLSGRKIQFPQIYALRNLVSNCKKSGKVQLFLDIHGHSVLKNSFMFGPMISQQNKLKYLPFLMSKKCDYFSLQNCRFKTNQNKIQTSRIYFQEKQNLLTYTCENSLGLMGAKKQYTKQQLESMKRLDVTAETANTIIQANKFHWRTIGNQIINSLLTLLDARHGFQHNIQIERLKNQQSKYFEKINQKMIDRQLRKVINNKSNSPSKQEKKKQDCKSQYLNFDRKSFKYSQGKSSKDDKNGILINQRKKYSVNPRQKSLTLIQNSKGFKIRKTGKDLYRLKTQSNYEKLNNQQQSFLKNQSFVQHKNLIQKETLKQEDQFLQTKNPFLQSSHSYRRQKQQNQENFQFLPRSKTDKDHQLKRFIEQMSKTKQLDFPSQKDSSQSSNFDLNVMSINLKKPIKNQNVEQIKSNNWQKDLYAINQMFQENYSESESINDSDTQSQDLNANQKRQLLKQIYQLRKNVSNEESASKKIQRSPSKQAPASKSFKQYVFTINQQQNRKNDHSAVAVPIQNKLSNSYSSQNNNYKCQYSVTRQNLMIQRSLKRQSNTKNIETFHMHINSFDQKQKQVENNMRRLQIQKFKEKIKKNR